MNRLRVLLHAVCVVTMALFLVHAQDDTKETRTMKLRMKESQIKLDEAIADQQKKDAAFKESQTLFEKGLYSKTEVTSAEEASRQSKLDRDQAEIDLEKTRLAFLNNALNVTLEKATLYLDDQGQKHARLSIRNNSNTSLIIDEEGRYSQKEKDALLSVDNLMVRLLLDRRLIGRPFEVRVSQLAVNQRKDIDFVLQRDAEAVTVEMSYGDKTVSLPVYLEKEAKDDRVLMDAMQFSQEGELGGRVTYDLSLERFVDDNETFSLEVVNLPGDYTYEFHETEEGSNQDQRVARIRFKKGTTTKMIRFVINMPKEIPKEQLNEKITMQVMILDKFAQQRLATIRAAKQGLSLNSRDLDSAQVSYETLEMVPRGRAEVTITSTNLFIKAKVGDVIKYSFDLQNTGTVSLDRIRAYLTLPLNWTASMAPEKDITLDVEGKKKIDVEVIPAVDVIPGDYEIKIEARTVHQGRDIEATSKIMRLQVEGKSSFLIGALLMLGLVGMIVGVAVMTIKVSRR